MYADQNYSCARIKHTRRNTSPPATAASAAAVKIEETSATATTETEAAPVKTGEAPAPVETEIKTAGKQTRCKFYCRRENDLIFIRCCAEMDGRTYPPEPVRKTDKLKKLYGGIVRTTAEAAAAIGAFPVNLP